MAKSKRTIGPPTDRDWEAENDASTLVEASVIRADKRRMSRAKKAAVKLAKEQQVRASALKKVARTAPLKGRGKRTRK